MVFMHVIENKWKIIVLMRRMGYLTLGYVTNKMLSSLIQNV